MISAGLICFAAIEESHGKEMLALAQAVQREMPAEQKQQVTENRTDTPAPDFSLEQLGGGTVKSSRVKRQNYS
ncbi:MAG: hypothetical protein IPP40_18195 [bacterium]|nr:hypothetical protein [bacterium]